MSSAHLPGRDGHPDDAPWAPPPSPRHPPSAPAAPEAPPEPARTRADPPPAPAPPLRRGGGSAAGARLRTKLASRAELRDAFLLHEVLGPPVALRTRRDRTP